MKLKFAIFQVVFLANICLAAIKPQGLRCEYLVDPAGIDETSPRLSWEASSTGRGEKQTACRIIVASSIEVLNQTRGDLWDSGKTVGDSTAQIVYKGQPLTSRQRCYWKVRLWDAHGKASDWSPVASWSMGLLEAGDWKAEWIGFRDASPLWTNVNQLNLPPARHYRKDFQAHKSIRRAVVHATALGLYELQINGQRVGDRYFTPGWTDYRRRVYYQTYDVTSLLRRGPNAIGAIVTDGWYAGYVGYGLLVGYGPHKSGRNIYGKTPALLAQLEVDYEDGTGAIVATDASWKTTDKGPIREADMLMGEAFDARLALDNWSKPGFNDSAWEAAIRSESNGSDKAPFFDGSGRKEMEFGFIRPAKVQAYPAVPVRRIQEIKPVSIHTPTNGVYIFNLGQNFAGAVRLKVKGPSGTKIQLRYGEMIHPDGRLMTENLRKARATDYYILRGDASGETWAPGFTFHGFQYVEIVGYPGKPELDAITGLVIHSDTPLTSEFECSDPMVNRLFKNIVWTQRANFLELPTDCPQRDEREGWMGDAQVYARAATYNADVASFFTKWLQEVDEAQLPNGAFPDYCPWPFQHGKAFATAWTDAGIICPWTIWKVYGDTRVIERHYAAMTRFMDWRKSASKDYLGVEHKDGNTWGDWLNLNENTPLDYIDTIFFAYTSRLMGDMAQAIGKDADAASYRGQFEKIRNAYVKKYVKEGALTVDTQSAYALALFAGLISGDQSAPMGKKLADKIMANDGRMATGFLGTRPLLPALSLAGQHDLALRLLQSRKFPSWGFEVENGATTIWERWDSYTKQDAFGKHNAAMNSFAHYSFGAVCEWMFQTLAGIDTDGAGYRKLIIRPSPAASGGNPDAKPIDWVKACYRSLNGPVSCEWRQTEKRFTLKLTIPANVTATVYLPARDSRSIRESGKGLEKSPFIRFLRMEGDRAVLEVESGAYSFESERP
jgi:alpha-L-rhamnosidase